MDNHERRAEELADKCFGLYKAADIALRQLRLEIEFERRMPTLQAAEAREVRRILTATHAGIITQVQEALARFRCFVKTENRKDNGEQPHAGIRGIVRGESNRG